jgi:hypothetical protein
MVIRPKAIMLYRNAATPAFGVPAFAVALPNFARPLHAADRSVPVQVRRSES